MIPKLDTITPRGNLCLWQTTDGVVGASFDLSTVDIDASDESAELTKWSRALSSLPTGLIARVETTCNAGQMNGSTDTRAKAINSIGFREYKTRLHIETKRNPFLEFIYRSRHGANGAPLRIEQGYKELKESGLTLSPLGENETSEIFERSSSAWVLDQRHLSKGEGYLGIVRLFRPTAQELTIGHMVHALTKLPAPYIWTTSIQKCAREVAEMSLQKKLRQSTGNGKVLGLKRDAIESALADTSLSGSEVFEYEVLITLERRSETELSTALMEAAGVLRAFGDVLIETVGVGPSFLATLPGVGLHVPLLEVDSTLPLFIPVWRQGAKAFLDKPSALAVHRRDLSLDQIDLLSKDNQNANAVIIGNSGRGKSALLGCLTEALLSDPRVRVIKVDVGGSHSKECDLVGGQEYRLNLETTHGLNPFALIHGKEVNGQSTYGGAEATESVRSIMSTFIESLVLEEGETRLPKEVKIEIDEMLQYSINGNDPLSIDTLLKFQFSRSKLLSRWGKKGLYGKAFCGPQAAALEKATAGWQLDSDRVGSREMNNERVGSRIFSGLAGTRLRYFNFQDIFQASDQDFSQGVMAAVLAVFNLEMRNHPDSRLVLICDETPFFIEKCFSLFKLSTANVRKFGGSVILVAQASKHLVVGGDTSLIDNSYNRILFSADGDLEDFRERFRLREKDMAYVLSLTFKNKEYSEFLYQNGDESKVMKLKLTPEEYWRITSSQADNLKLKKLLQAVDGLTLDQAVFCLSAERS